MADHDTYQDPYGGERSDAARTEPQHFTDAHDAYGDATQSQFNDSYDSYGDHAATTRPQQFGGERAWQPTEPQGFVSDAATPGGYPGAVPTQPQPAGAAAPAAAKPSGVKTFFIAFAGALLACLLAFGIAAAYNAMQGANNLGSSSSIDTELGAQTNTPIEVVGEDATLAEAVASKCLPSVVAVDVYASSAASTYYGGTSGQLQQTSSGSGVVLTADGYIITNNHVVSGGSSFIVTIDGLEYSATLVGADPSSDVAVLKAEEANNLTPMEIGNSDALSVGEWVMTLGSPFGLEQSVATGIISATNRSQVMDSSSYASQSYSVLYPSLIQTDAAINPGNSGGALVNAEGKLVGINTMISTTSGQYSGVGFAIPSNYAVNLAQQIIDGKTPTHAYLGVSLSSINAEIAARYGLPTDKGVYVASVVPGSAAANAGIVEGDIITAFDGKEVTTPSSLMLDVRLKAPGDVVKVTINHDGETKDVDVTLGDDSVNQTQQNAQGDQSQQGQQGQQGQSLEDLFGQGGQGSIFDQLFGN